MSSLAPRRQFPLPPKAPRALVLRAHPRRDSFSDALADAWSDGARGAGVDVHEVSLAALDFELQLRAAHRADQPLEPDLASLKQAFADSAHLTVATPIWWGSTPAVLKGLFDRLFLPGWAYQISGSGLPKRGLTGRSARLLLTMDSPEWWDRLAYGRSARRQLRDATLRFVGYRPVSVSSFAAISASNPAQREAMLRSADKVGRRDGAALIRRFRG